MIARRELRSLTYRVFQHHSRVDACGRCKRWIVTINFYLDLTSGQSIDVTQLPVRGGSFRRGKR